MKIGRGFSVLVIAPLFVLENKERDSRLEERSEKLSRKTKVII
jgi:hypothetical protein